MKINDAIEYAETIRSIRADLKVLREFTRDQSDAYDRNSSIHNWPFHYGQLAGAEFILDHLEYLIDDDLAEILKETKK